jgi:hypothetical protein
MRGLKRFSAIIEGDSTGGATQKVPLSTRPLLALLVPIPQGDSNRLEAEVAKAEARAVGGQQRFMRSAGTLAPLLKFAALGLALASCRNECFPTPTAPCPLPLALAINVTAVPTGGPVSGAFVEVSGAVIATIPCSTGTDATVCHVLGYAGTYDLEVGAAGFQTTQRSVRVQGTTPACGCATVAIEHLSVVLVASS